MKRTTRAWEILELEKKVRVDLKVETQEKAQKVGVKESLLLIEAFRRTLASLLSTELRNRRFW